MVSTLDYPAKVLSVTSCSKCTNSACTLDQKYGFCFLISAKTESSLRIGSIAGQERYTNQETERWILEEIALFGGPQ